MPALIPRAIIVTRATDYELLLARYGTRAQARFALKETGDNLETYCERQCRIDDTLATVARGVPPSWRVVRLKRSDLDRFVFEPSDIVLAVGQDGLVANVAKYLTGQLVIGFNPDPQIYEGALVRNSPADAARLVSATSSGTIAFEDRTMVQATLADGQQLLALNEIFIGQRSHQSARYQLRVGQRAEHQSSSGLIVSTGTGSTGWARSINAERRSSLQLPKPMDSELALFVREAFPGSGFQATLTETVVHQGESVVVTSEMDDAGVIFGDGIEDDRIPFGFGAQASIGVAANRLRLVVDTAASTVRTAT